MEENNSSSNSELKHHKLHKYSTYLYCTPIALENGFIWIPMGISDKLFILHIQEDYG